MGDSCMKKALEEQEGGAGRAKKKVRESTRSVLLPLTNSLQRPRKGG